MSGIDLSDIRETGEALSRLAEDEALFTRAAKAFVSQDADEFRAVVDKLQLHQHAELLCQWFCRWNCVRLCRVLCVRLPAEPPKLSELRDFVRVFAGVADRRDVVERLVAAIDREDSDSFGKTLAEFGLSKWCYLVCYWICFLRCELFCRRVAGTGEEQDLFDAIRESGEVLAVVAEDRRAFTAIHEAAETQDVEAVRAVLERIDLVSRCQIICRWLCVWHCLRVCLRLCPRVREIPQLEELAHYARLVARLVADDGSLSRLVDAMGKRDARAWQEVLQQHDLTAFCQPLCLWLCHWHCRPFCLILCPPADPLPLFRKVGGITYATAIDSGAGGSGLTLADQRAFYNTLRLNGVIYQKLYGQPTQYRFEYDDGAGWQPVAPAQIGKTVIGTWTRFIGGPNPVEAKDYTVNGANGPGEVTIIPAADGWIKVPQEANFWTAEGQFTSNGNMIHFVSETLNTATDLDLAGIAAGSSTSAAGLAVDQVISLRMRVRNNDLDPTGQDAGVCLRLALANRLYDNVAKKGSWAPTTASDQRGAAMLNLDEIAGGCGKVTNTLTARYTAAHPNLGAVALTMDGPGGPYAFTMSEDPTATPQNRFGSASPTVSVANLPKCAYLVKLQVDLLLTTGDTIPDPLWDEVAFCK